MSQKLSEHPIHLGLGATAKSQPKFVDPMLWYQAYGQRSQPDGIEGRLVSSHTFSSSWNVWEMHPHGSEVVLCISGSVTLIQTEDTEASQSTRTTVSLKAGEYAINPPGVWHTADVEEGAETSVVFITAGKDTQNKPR